MAQTSGADATTTALSTHKTTTVRASERRCAAPARIEAAPVATSTKIGARRKLKNRGATFVCVAQKARTVATTGAPRTNALTKFRDSGLEAMTTRKPTTKISDANEGDRSTSSVEGQCGDDGLVDRGRDRPRGGDAVPVRLERAVSDVVDMGQVPDSDCGGRQDEPDCAARPQLFLRKQDGRHGDERDREVRQRPAPDDACDEDGDERGGSSRADGLEGSDDEDAHREEGEAVAARLARDVEQERRRRREEEEEDARERAEPDVKPGGDEPDAERGTGSPTRAAGRSPTRRRPSSSPSRAG